MDSSNDSSMGFTTGIASLYKSNHPALFSVFPTMMAEFRNETVLVLLSAQELALKCKTKAQNIRAQLSAIMVVFFLFLSFFMSLGHSVRVRSFVAFPPQVRRWRTYGY